MIFFNFFKGNEKKNSFQLNIFKEINKKNINENITISPISIYHILSLTANGAANSTLEEMLNTLCHKDLNEINKSNMLISSIINKSKTVEFANGVFTRETPVPSFTQMIKQYEAKIDKLKDANSINKWCSDVTHSKISKVIDFISPDDVMILINAIYFKGSWLKTFNEKYTEKRIFMNCYKDKSLVDFMYMKEKFDYFEDEKIQAISLKYKQDNMVATIILPQDNVNDYIENLTLQKYKDLINKMKNIKVKLYLPKFEINYETELSNTIKSLGMIQAFSSNANFSSMVDVKDAYIGKIYHKAYIKIDEKGTVASAVTYSELRSMNRFRPTIPEMKINRPFLFIIRNEKLPYGDDIFFMSKIEKIEGYPSEFLFIYERLYHH